MMAHFCKARTSGANASAIGNFEAWHEDIFAWLGQKLAYTFVASCHSRQETSPSQSNEVDPNAIPGDEVFFSLGVSSRATTGVRWRSDLILSVTSATS